MSKIVKVEFLEMSSMNVPTNDSELKLMQDYAQQHNLLINTKNSEINY